MRMARSLVDGAAFDCLHADFFQGLGEARPSASLPSSLARCFSPPVQAKIEAIGLVEVSLPASVVAIVPSDRAVGGFRFHGLAVRGHQHRGHQAERAEALRHCVRLHVAVVVFAGPDELAGPFKAAATISSISRCS